MAMITQAGVDKLTAGLRAGFDAENERRRRERRLRRAARGSIFDPDDERRENAVELERRAQQAQDMTRAEQGVRQRYAFDPVFSGPTRLFDAGDISTLPASVLARHGSMAPAEMVRTEKQRVNASGGAWTAGNDFDAGRALGSRPMMVDASRRMETEDREVAERDAEELRRQTAIAKRLERADHVTAFDTAVARGEEKPDRDYRDMLGGRSLSAEAMKRLAMRRSITAPKRASAFDPIAQPTSQTTDARSNTLPAKGGSGGTITRGSRTFDVPAGDVDAGGYRRAAPRTPAIPQMIERPAMLPKTELGRLKAGGVTHVGAQPIDRVIELYGGTDNDLNVHRLRRRLADIEAALPGMTDRGRKPLEDERDVLNRALAELAGLLQQPAAGDQVRTFPGPGGTAMVIQDQRYTPPAPGGASRPASATAAPAVKIDYSDARNEAAYARDYPNAAAFNYLTDYSGEGIAAAAKGAGQGLDRLRRAPFEAFDLWDDTLRANEISRQAKARERRERFKREQSELRSGLSPWQRRSLYDQ